MRMVRPKQAHGLRSKVYGPVVLAIFRRKYVVGSTEPLAFTLNEIREELLTSGLSASNAPDVVYRMRGRTMLPEEIQNAGYRMIINTDRGAYAFVAGTSTLVDYPEMTNVVEVDDHTPVEVRRLLYADFVKVDEQALLSVLRYNDMFSRFLGFRVYHFKSHVRQSVRGVGQAEVDDVHVAVEHGYDGPLTIVPVEAKAQHDPVVRTQVVTLVHYAEHVFPGHPIRPMTVKLLETGEVLFMEFNVTKAPDELRIVRHAFYRLLVHGT
jgi:hypothetical protein